MASAAEQDHHFDLSGIRDSPGKRTNLRAKNGRDALHRSHLKQIKCAQGFDDDVCQGTMPCVEVR